MEAVASSKINKGLFATSARAKEIINKFANLEFRLVAAPDARPSQTENYDYEGAPVSLERRNIVTGDQVTNAVQEYDPESGLPQVSITLDNDGDGATDCEDDNCALHPACLPEEKVRCVSCFP